MNIKINEIFKSIQGESTFVGLPCVFVRLSGCNLRCLYCDTVYAFDNGKDMEIDEICETVAGFGVNLVCITGGEPLVQNNVVELVEKLIQFGYNVLIETNGSVKIGSLPDKVIKILDIKCPGSGESDKMDLSNLEYLRPCDEVKFVISSKLDYEWAKNFVYANKLERKANLLFGAVSGLLESRDLAKWILQDNLNVRLQIQLHKYLGVD